MKTFFEWLKDRELMTEGAADRKKLMELLSNADWTDNSGVKAEFSGWEHGSKEIKILLKHPQVGPITITVVRNISLPPKQIFKSVMSDYIKQVERLKYMQAKRKAV